MSDNMLTTKHMMTLAYEEQLKVKQAYLNDLFINAKITCPVNNIIANPHPKKYRHKVVLSAIDVHKKIRLGLFIENTKTIQPGITHILQDEAIENVLKTIEELLNQFKYRAYQEKNNEGLIKHVMIRKSHFNGDMLVIFVTNGHIFPSHKDMIKILVKKQPCVKTVFQNIQNKPTKMVLQKEERLLYGPGQILDKIGDMSFLLTAQSFYQVNPYQTPKLYEIAIQAANIQTDDIVLDCYGGIATIGILASQHAKKVISIESNPYSSQQAFKNVKLNQLKHVDIVNRQVEEAMIMERNKVDCVLMDPSRDGASKAFLDALIKVQSKTVIYVSCEPKTLIRDLLYLKKYYKIIYIQPVDMFSYTPNIEMVCKLERISYD